MALDDLLHPDAERLAEYAEGTLEVAARAEIERHLADCAACRAVVMETVAFLEMNPAEQASAATVIPFRSRRKRAGVAAALAVAAGLVLAVFVARPEWLSGARGGRPELQELIAAVANEPTRPVEGQLSGFAYAPPPSPTRGRRGRAGISPAATDAIEKVILRHQSASDPASRSALGVASLIAGRLDEAVAALEDAVRAQPDDARFQSDLASAYLERARFGSHPEDLSRALQAADRALAQNVSFLNALFNRALVLEQQGKPREALTAWETYHRVDPGGPASDEAVKHALGLMKVADANPDAVFRAVSELTARHAILPQLPFNQTIFINGGVNSTDYPASFFASLNEDVCSATFIGPSVVLTAAHCVPFDHGKIWLIRLGRLPLVGRCDRATTYNRNHPSGVPVDDWALCKMDNPSPVPAEVVNIDPAVVQAHTGLIVTGYGCDMTNGKPTIGVSFEIGYMEVADPDRNGTGVIWATPINGTTLCPGDSGGGTFTPFANNRLAVAANSTSDQKTSSTMSNLSSKPGRDFLYTWSNCRRQPICGLDATLSTTACRIPMPSGNTAFVPASFSCPVAWLQP